MYIITGGAGFIGSAFVSKLNEMGIEDIIIVDNLGPSEKWKNLKNNFYLDYLHKDDFLRLVKSDNVRSLHKSGVVQGIIHLGACSTTTEEDMDYLMENNFRYSRVLARYAQSIKARFIYASSAATYGAGEDGYSDDEGKIRDLKPMNRYGYSKHIFDLWLLRNKLQDQMVGLKFFNVYGPNEYHKGGQASVVFHAFNQIQETGRVKLFKSTTPEYGDGEQMRDFVYVKDCCEIMWQMLEDRSVNGIFNIGTGKARCWNDLVTAVFSALGKETVIEYIDMPEKLRKQYQNFTEAEMWKLKAAGIDHEFHSLEDGVKDYVAGYLNTDEPFV